MDKYHCTYNPRLQPNPTRDAVVAARTYAMQNVEHKVRIRERDASRTTNVEKPSAIPAAPIAV